MTLEKVQPEVKGIDYLSMIAVPEDLSSERILDAAFALSAPLVPQLHYGPGNLLPGEAQALINHSSRVGMAFSADVVKGRRVKLVLFQDPSTGQRYLRRTWADHSPRQLQNLLNTLQIPYEGDLG